MKFYVIDPRMIGALSQLICSERYDGSYARGAQWSRFSDEGIIVLWMQHGRSRRGM